MISLENKELKNQKGLKLCKTHKKRRPRICRNGKLKLNMTKVVSPRNFRHLRKKSYVNYDLNQATAKKVEQRR
ncbi:MAG: hypothetical protein J6T29_03575 [Alphaproteobacteria bacterium]|nr:hypothetical protein [Alphaproteobacteria bacterium]